MSLNPFITGRLPERDFPRPENYLSIPASPSQVGYGGRTTTSRRTTGSAIQLHHLHRTGGYNGVTYLHASPLLAMLQSPEGFPLQSQALCPRRYFSQPPAPQGAISLAVRRRTSRSFPCSVHSRMYHRRERFCRKLTIRLIFRISAYDAVIRCRRIRYATTGLEFAPWKLGFNQSRLNLYPLRDFLHTRLAVHHTTYLRVYPLS